MSSVDDELKLPYYEELLTASEIAKLLKVPVSWVYDRTRRQGIDRMPHLKLGKYLRFELFRVQEWLKHQER